MATGFYRPEAVDHQQVYSAFTQPPLRRGYCLGNDAPLCVVDKRLKTAPLNTRRLLFVLNARQCHGQVLQPIDHLT